MARFYGQIGYAQTVRTAPGVSSEEITERDAYGDIVQNRSLLRGGDKVNPDVVLGNSVSVVADALAREHFLAIRYVRWAGQVWTVLDTEIQPPRLILRLGEVYNGPTSGAPDSP